MATSIPPKTATAATLPVIRSRQVPSRRRRDGLIRYAKDVNSQNGEDGILERLFEILPPAGSNDSLLDPHHHSLNNATATAVVTTTATTRWCVDLGAWDGKHLSNTYQLLFQPSSQWRGILVEADPERVRQLKDLHRNTGNICLQVTVSTESPQDPNNLHNVLRHHHAFESGDGVPLPNRFDFLCIDIDGPDYWVLHDLWTCSTYEPSVVCIEFNPTMPDSLIYIPPRTARHGASLAALVELAEQHDHVLVETTLFNAFFVRRALYEQYLRTEVPETTMEALHETTMGTHLYQLYDGTLKLSGCKRMLWHRIPLDERQIQVLPLHERVFPFAPSANEQQQQRVPEDASLFLAKAVDLSPYRNRSDSTMDAEDDTALDTRDETQAQRRREAAQQLLLQLQRDGFALVRGTGMSWSTGQSALRATQALLQDADEAVRRSCLSQQDRARRGYVPMNAENFASLLPSTHGLPQPNDLVRKFRVGPLSRSQDDEESQTSSKERNLCHNSLLQPNVWPTTEHSDDESILTFRSDVETYYNAACRSAQIVLQAICDGLLALHPSLEPSLRPLMQQYPSHCCNESDTSAKETTTTSILTLLGYRFGTRHKGKHKGPLVAAHTDVGVITLLLFDGGRNTCAKLQRRDCRDDTGEDGWVDVDLPSTVPRDDPILVVNVADCLAELSNGILPSTVHRVVAVREEPQSHVPRNCCALFVGLDPDCELPLGDSDTPIITYEEWRRRRIARSQAALKNAGRTG